MENIVIVDRIEEDEYNGKPFKRLLTKSGETFKIGIRLEPKWILLKPGAAVRLIMDEYKGNAYVKDFDLCYDLTMDKMAELSQPAPKNPRDASIERQVAIKCVVDLICADKMPDQEIIESTMAWLRQALK